MQAVLPMPGECVCEDYLAIHLRATLLSILDRNAEAEKNFVLVLSHWRRKGKDASERFTEGMPIILYNHSHNLVGLGRLKEADEEFKKCLSLLSQKSNASLFDNQIAGEHCGYAGALQSFGYFAESLPYFEYAIRLRRQIVAESDGVEFSIDLARSLACQATSLFELEEYQSARNSLSEAIKIYRGLPEDTRCLSENQWLIDAYVERADSSFFLEEYEAAIEDYYECNRLLTARVRDAVKSNTSSDSEIAYNWDGIGICHSGIGESEKAIAAFNKAVGFSRRSMCLSESENSKLQKQLAGSLLDRALAYWDLGKSQTARIDFAESLKLTCEVLNSTDAKPDIRYYACKSLYRLLRIRTVRAAEPLYCSAECAYCAWLNGQTRLVVESTVRGLAASNKLMSTALWVAQLPKTLHASY